MHPRQGGSRGWKGRCRRAVALAWRSVLDPHVRCFLVISVVLATVGLATWSPSRNIHTDF